MNTIHISLPTQPDRCPLCGWLYVHIQHPMKPPGVSMCSACGCAEMVKRDQLLEEIGEAW
jgi:hypothetical protein